jgi:hypothetical protein
MAPNGDVKTRVGSTKTKNKKQGERESGTNLVKMPLGEQGCDWDHMGAHKRLAQVGG